MSVLNPGGDCGTQQSSGVWAFVHNFLTWREKNPYHVIRIESLLLQALKSERNIPVFLFYVADKEIQVQLCLAQLVLFNVCTLNSQTVDDNKYVSAWDLGLSMQNAFP